MRLESELVIEVDGGRHPEPRANDEKPTEWLVRRGCSLSRFWSNDVLARIADVVARIDRMLHTGIQPPSRPSPCHGEGD